MSVGHAKPAIEPRLIADNPSMAPVRLWLAIIAGLIAAMVLVGGATRLTDSGLSITEWRPATGVVPPLNTDAWILEFDKYKKIPEYSLVNPDMTLAEFKSIYWWEWGHRMLGRLIGLAFALPMAIFFATRRLRRRHLPLMLGLFVLGGLQGAIGWWMVKSGLSDRVDVSHLRLAVHLTLACGIFAAVVAVALSLGRRRQMRERPAIVVAATALLFMVLLQIFLGGLVAGMHAGLTFNTWPLMDGRLIPSDLLLQSPVWINLIDNAKTVQFDHRLMAYLVALLTLFHAAQLYRIGGRFAAARGTVILISVFAQLVFGIVTLLAGVPIALGLIHQAGALAVLLAVTWNSVVAGGYA